MKRSPDETQRDSRRGDEAQRTNAAGKQRGTQAELLRSLQRLTILATGILALNFPGAAESTKHLFRSEAGSAEIEFYVRRGAEAAADLRDLKNRIQQDELTLNQALTEFFQIAGEIRTTVATHRTDPKVVEELHTIFNTYLMQTAQDGWEYFVVDAIRRVYDPASVATPSVAAPESLQITEDTTGH